MQFILFITQKIEPTMATLTYEIEDAQDNQHNSTVGNQTPCYQLGSKRSIHSNTEQQTLRLKNNGFCSTIFRSA